MGETPKDAPKDTDMIYGQLRVLTRELRELSLMLRVDNPLSLEVYIDKVLRAVKKIPRSARLCVVLSLMALTSCLFVPNNDYRKRALAIAGNLLGLAFYLMQGE